MTERPERYAIDLPAAVIARPNGPQALARVQNVSAEGLLLAELAQPLAREDSIWIELPRSQGRGRVGVLGRVCWTDRDRAGIAIEAMLPHHRYRYAEMLASIRA